MVFITIDGLSGSGKSTQLHILCKELRLRPSYVFTSRRVFRIMAELLGNMNEYMSIPAHLYATYTCRDTKARIIVDHYWEEFCGVYAESPKTFENIIRILRTGITICGHREPNLSIILDVPSVEAEVRCLGRRGLKTTPQELEIPETILTYHRVYRDFCIALEAEIPYCHIVDGNKPVEDVTQSIMQLIP